MSGRGCAAWGVAVIVVLALAGGCGHRAPAAQVPPVPAGEGPVHSKIGFRSRDRLEEHFRKHGREFGATSQEAYLRMAQTLRDRPVGGPVLEAVRGDGVATRFDRDGGAFLAFNRDLTIRTFFRPNDGEAYFQRQARR